MSVRPDAQMDEVEPRDPFSEHAAQLAVIRLRVACVHRMDPRVHVIEQSPLGHSVVRVGVIGGDASLVPEEHLDVLPRIGDLGEPFVDRFRRGPSRQRDGARARLQELLHRRSRQVIDHAQLGSHAESSSARDTRATLLPRSRSAIRSPAACAAMRWPKVYGSPGIARSACGGSTTWTKSPVSGPPLCSWPVEWRKRGPNPTVVASRIRSRSRMRIAWSRVMYSCERGMYAWMAT